MIQRVKTGVIADGAITTAKMNDEVENLFSFRNRIINGDMRIAQRATSATFSGTGQNGTSFNTIDRFSFSTFGVTFPSGVYATTAQVEDAPTGFLNSFRVTANQTLTVGSSNARGIWVSQGIEGFNISDSYNSTITLSFWVKSSNIGTYSLTFQNNNGGYATSYVINSANTWEYKTVTLVNSTSLGTPDNTTGLGLRVVFGLGGDSTWIGTATANQWVAGNIPYLHGCKNLFDTANATWQVTGVQLEVGPIATPFERRPYGLELQLCQRYHWQITAASGNQTPLNVSFYNSRARMGVQSPVPMRGAPTITFIGDSPGAFFTTNDDSSYVNFTYTGGYSENNSSGYQSIGLNFTSSSAGPGGGIVYIQNSRTIRFTSEV